MLFCAVPDAASKNKERCLWHVSLGGGWRSPHHTAPAFMSSAVSGGKNHPDIASLVCYALLHAAVFVGFSCVWKEAFARRASLSNKNLCRAGPVSVARRHFEYSIIFVSQLSSAPCQHVFNE